MPQKIKTHSLMYTTTSAEPLKRNGKKIILICQVFLSFILLSLSNSCFSNSFSALREKILNNEICHIAYNPSKSAAIVSTDCDSAIYINFKTKRLVKIYSGWISFSADWKSEDIVIFTTTCGTGCAQSKMFIAPSTIITCPVHEFRLESLNLEEPPDFYNNRFLLVDTHKKIYICYAEENVIQIFKMPSKLQAVIHPPKGYYADEANIRHGQLSITYLNINEKVKKIIYPHFHINHNN